MLANIDTFNRLQATQNALFGFQGSVFNEWNAVENVTVRVAGKVVDMNHPDQVPDPYTIPIVRSDEMVGVVKELEKIESIAENLIESHKSIQGLSEQQKRQMDERVVRALGKDFSKRKSAIE